VSSYLPQARRSVHVRVAHHPPTDARPADEAGKLRHVLVRTRAEISAPARQSDAFGGRIVLGARHLPLRPDRLNWACAAGLETDRSPLIRWYLTSVLAECARLAPSPCA